MAFFFLSIFFFLQSVIGVFLMRLLFLSTLYTKNSLLYNHYE